MFEGFVHRHFLKSMCWFQGVYELTKVLLRNYPKIGHVSVELIASMSWRRRLCDHSCLPSRHHPNEESWKDSRLIKTKSRVNQVDQLTKRNWQCSPHHGIAWSLSVHLVRFVCWSTWFTLDLVLINLALSNSLHLDDVLKVNMNDHTIFFFKTCLQ